MDGEIAVERGGNLRTGASDTITITMSIIIISIALVLIIMTAVTPLIII